jgi:hypothetical protein
VVFVVGIVVPAAVGGHGIGEGSRFVTHVARRSQRAQVDIREISMGVKAGEPGRVGATFLNRLRVTQQLDRIVIDECHIVLNRRIRSASKCSRWAN